MWAGLGSFYPFLGFNRIFAYFMDFGVISLLHALLLATEFVGLSWYMYVCLLI